MISLFLSFFFLNSKTIKRRRRQQQQQQQQQQRQTTKWSSNSRITNTVSWAKRYIIKFWFFTRWNYGGCLGGNERNVPFNDSKYSTKFTVIKRNFFTGRFFTILFFFSFDPVFDPIISVFKYRLHVVHFTDDITRLHNQIFWWQCVPIQKIIQVVVGI